MDSQLWQKTGLILAWGLIVLPHTILWGVKPNSERYLWVMSWAQSQNAKISPRKMFWISYHEQSRSFFKKERMLASETQPTRIYSCIKPLKSQKNRGNIEP